MLAEIDVGRMDASAVLRARIEGALVVLGADIESILDRLLDSSDSTS